MTTATKICPRKGCGAILAGETHIYTCYRPGCGWEGYEDGYGPGPSGAVPIGESKQHVAALTHDRRKPGRPPGSSNTRHTSGRAAAPGTPEKERPLAPAVAPIVAEAQPRGPERPDGPPEPETPVVAPVVAPGVQVRDDPILRVTRTVECRTMAELLSLALEITGEKGDAFAALLGVGQQALTHMRRGRVLYPEAVRKLAEIVGRPEEEVWAFAYRACTATRKG